MSKQDEVRYDRRTVRDWVRKAFAGEIAITDFQRSFVWPNDKMANYIKAIIDGKPVGLYLILETDDPPQFEPREFNKMGTPLDSVGELVLDGQQRLTSLLQTLYQQSERRFFIQVTDLSADKLEVLDILSEDKSTKNGRKYDIPENAYFVGRIPMDILLDDTDERGLTPLARWCIAVGDHVGTDESRVLESKINKFINEHFFERPIWYCWLPASIDRSTATEIFVETNTSSVKIKRFDIEVANARGEHDEDLRNSIREAYQLPRNTVLRHYFKEDPEDWIPDIGEWMLKVACLRTGQAPREKNYGDALKFLFRRQDEDRFPEIERMFGDLAWILERVAELGAATRRTVPSWPPLHVLAALRPELEIMRDPAKIDAARRLHEAYYWRSLFSNRHDVQANDRLHQDFVALKSALKQIRDQGTWDTEQPAFKDNAHPLYTENDLLRHAGWIGSSSRLGRALASVAMSRHPPDWITGESLNPNKVRELEREGQLDRHHVFSRDALKKAGEKLDRIQNGLNGVFLDRKTNRRLANAPPEKYLKQVVQTSQTSEDELRSRIEQHFVPYDEMKDEGPIMKRYDDFLRKRAMALACHIKPLAQLLRP